MALVGIEEHPAVGEGHRELQGVLQRKELRVEVTLTVPDERLHESRYSDTVVVESSDVHVPPAAR